MRRAGRIGRALLLAATLPLTCGKALEWSLEKYGLPRASSSSGNTGGVKLALTQNFLDYAVSVSKPAALDFMRNFKFPDPVAKGDGYSISWWVNGVQLSNLDVDLRLSLESPSSLTVSLSNLRLKVDATAHFREDVWPHPQVNVGIVGNADGSSALATLAVSTDGHGIPSISLGSCTPNILANNVHVVSGLIWPFDQLADMVISSYKGVVIQQVGSMICDTGIHDTLIEQMLNPFLKAWSYQVALPFPPPFDQGVLDYHLTGSPLVVGSSDAYLEAAVTARVDVGGSKSLSPMPTMPSLPAGALGSHMLSVQLSPYLLNTALYGFDRQGLLAINFTKSSLPPGPLQDLLTTDFFSLLLPKLEKAYPHADLILNLTVTSLPAVSFASADATMRVDAKAEFLVDSTATKGAPLPAFSLLGPALEASLSLGVTNGSSAAIVGSFGHVNLQLEAGNSSFGDLGPDILAALSTPLSQIVNDVVIPVANQVISRGIPIPSVDQTVGDYHIKAAVTQPELLLKPGYGLIGTDLDVSITPTASVVRRSR